MAERRPETVIDAFDGLYLWPAAKPGMTLIGSRTGRVLLTSQRFLFLSTGTSGIGKQLLFSAVGGPERAQVEPTSFIVGRAEEMLSTRWRHGAP